MYKRQILQNIIQFKEYNNVQYTVNNNYFIVFILFKNNLKGLCTLITQ